MAYFNGKNILFSPRIVSSAKMVSFIDGTLQKLVPQDFGDAKNVREGAFAGFENLESVELSDKIKTIGNRSFYNCASLKNVVIADSVETIGENAFHYNTGMDVVIGSGVKTIGSRAFGVIGSSKTLNVRIKADNPPTIESNSFPSTETNSVSIVVNAGMAEAYKSATNWSAFADVITEEENG